MTVPSDIRQYIPQQKPGPAYVHKDYPKMLSHEKDGKQTPHKHANGNPVIVNSKEEEDAFLEALDAGKKRGALDEGGETDTDATPSAKKKNKKLED